MRVYIMTGVRVSAVLQRCIDSCLVQVILVITCAVTALTGGNPVNPRSTLEPDDTSADDLDYKACSIVCGQETKTCYAACDSVTWLRVYCHGQCTYDEIACLAWCAFD